MNPPVSAEEHNREVHFLTRWPEASRVRSAVILACIVSACSGTETRTPTGVPPDTTGGGVQRATLELGITIGQLDSSIARQLGWASGLPGATLTVQRLGGGTALSAVANAQGVVEVTSLLPGTYVLSALRLLQPQERAQLDANDADVDAFGGGAILTIEAPRTTGTLVVVAGRRGSLVISEVWNGFPEQSNGSFYSFGHFVEVYNNGDVPLSLAGMLLVTGYAGSFDNPPFVTCSQSAPFQRDSLGIWTTLTYEFPPSAGTLMPGQTVLIATDALDHTTLATGTYDLAGADFEFRGAADTDNPQVPDMLSVGPSDGGDLLQHGMMVYATRPVIALAGAVNIGSLPRQRDGNNREWMRVPAENILDVLSFTGFSSATAVPCPQPVHISIDRQELLLTSIASENSLQRQVVTTMPDGRKVLLRTRTSARDFRAVPATPGSIP